MKFNNKWIDIFWDNTYRDRKYLLIKLEYFNGERKSSFGIGRRANASPETWGYFKTSRILNRLMALSQRETRVRANPYAAFTLNQANARQQQVTTKKQSCGMAEDGKMEHAWRCVAMGTVPLFTKNGIKYINNISCIILEMPLAIESINNYPFLW